MSDQRTPSPPLQEELRRIVTEGRELLSKMIPGPYAVEQVKGYCIDYIRTNHPDWPSKNYVGETGIGIGQKDEWVHSAPAIVWLLNHADALLTAASLSLAPEPIRTGEIAEVCAALREIGEEARRQRDIRRPGKSERTLEEQAADLLEGLSAAREAVLTKAMIKIAELPGPTPDTIPT